MALSWGSVTIKQHICTPVVHLLVMTPNTSSDVLVLYCAHSFIVNVQPSYPAIALSVWVGDFSGTVPSACGLAVVKYPIERVMGKGGTWDGGVEAGMVKPTAEAAESKGWEARAAPESREVNDLFRTGGLDAGTGASVDVGAGMDDAVDKISPMTGSAHGATISRCVVPSR